jgi:hypothetical protein
MMNEFNLIQVIFITNESANTALALYISIVSGYLFVAYTVGAKLTRYQITLVNALFVFFTAAFTYSATTAFMIMRFITGELRELKGGLEIINEGAENIFVSVVTIALIAGVLGSLTFMRNIRRGNQSDV